MTRVEASGSPLHFGSADRNQDKKVGTKFSIFAGRIILITLIYFFSW